MRRVTRKTINGTEYEEIVTEVVKGNIVVKSITNYKPSIPFDINFKSGKKMKTIKSNKKIKAIIYEEKEVVNFILE